MREYNLKLTGTLKATHERVRRVGEQYVKAMKKAYDGEHKEVTYKVGEAVKLYWPDKQPHLPKRLQLTYTGPHKVMRAHSNGLNYVLEVHGRMVTCHVSRLRQYHDDSHPEIGVKPFVDRIPESAEVDGEVAFVPPAVSAESAPIGHKDVDWETMFAGLDLGEPRDEAHVGLGNGVAEPLADPDEQKEKKSGVEEEEHGALWDNVLKGTEGALPVANPATIMAGHIVLWRIEMTRRGSGGSGRS